METFFAAERPDTVIMAAATVGGIASNIRRPVEHLEDNLRIQTNVIRSAARHGAARLVFIASSCMYPRAAPQPMREESLLTGPLEPTNEGYALAKIAGWKLCEAYRKQHGFDAITTVPTNIYGPGDNYDPETSHALPALLRRFHEAKVAGASSVTIWGTGRARREFLHTDDHAAATLFLLSRYRDAAPINVGVGSDVPIAELAEVIRRVVGFHGEIRYDPAKPDGMPRKLLDVSRLTALGWKARITLEEGIAATYRSYVAQAAAPHIGGIP